jgi:hypothetical protein
MFWWGNLFSFTLHLQGKSLDKYKSIIIKNSRILVDGKTYICVNDTPWEYHYSDDNYRIFTENDVMLINDLSFLKISCKYELEQYDRIPQLGVSFLEQCLELLKDEK